MNRPILALGIGAALASAVAYGINIVYARQATQLGMPPADLVVLRVALMLVAASAVIAATRGSLAVDRRTRPLLFVMGLLTAGIGLAYFFAVAYVPIGVAAIVFYTFPLLILIASPFVDGEAFTPSRFAIFAVAFLGLVIALGPTLGGVDLRGVVFAGLASLMAAGQFFLAARLGARIEQGPLIFWSHVIVIPIAVAVALGGGANHGAALGQAWAPTLITVTFYVVAFALQMLSAKHAPPALIGLVFCLEPVVAIVTAGVVLGETLSGAQMAGSVLVLASLVAASLLALRAPRKPA